MFILKRMMTKKEECENIFFYEHSVRSHEKGDVGSVKGPPFTATLDTPSLNRAYSTRGG